MSEVIAGLSAVMGCLHTDSESSLNQPLSHWGSWLEDEGFNATSLAAWGLEIASTVNEGCNSKQLESFYKASLEHGISTGEFLETLTNEAPGFVGAIQDRIGALLEADTQAKQLAGGKSLNVRPLYVASGASLLVFAYAWKKGYVHEAAAWTKEKAVNLYRSIRGTANEDLIRDRDNPIDILEQADEIQVRVPDPLRILGDIQIASRGDIERAASHLAGKEVDRLFAKTNLVNDEWFKETDRLIDKSVKIDMKTFRELSKADNNNPNSNLVERFNRLALKTPEFQADVIEEGQYMPWNFVKDSPVNINAYRKIFGNQLYRSYVTVLKDAKNAADLVEDGERIETDTEEFILNVKNEAMLRCAEIRSKAVNDFNNDMKEAKKAMSEEGLNFIDVESEDVADYVADFDSLVDDSL